MSYSTIDPEIQFGVFKLLRQKGYGEDKFPELYSDEMLRLAQWRMQSDRTIDRARMSNRQQGIRARLNYWLNCSINNQIAYLADLIINNRKEFVQLLNSSNHADT